MEEMLPSLLKPKSEASGSSTLARPKASCNHLSISAATTTGAQWCPRPSFTLWPSPDGTLPPYLYSPAQSRKQARSLKQDGSNDPGEYRGKKHRHLFTYSMSFYRSTSQSTSTAENRSLPTELTIQWEDSRTSDMQGDEDAAGRNSRRMRWRTVGASWEVGYRKGP